jgi:hypothetical protein
MKANIVAYGIFFICYIMTLEKTFTLSLQIFMIIFHYKNVVTIFSRLIIFLCIYIYVVFEISCGHVAMPIA